MGVNSCDRAGCSSILCHKLLDTGKNEYYICGDCQRDLAEEVMLWPIAMATDAFFQRIEEFMRKPANGETIEPVRYLEKLLSEGKNRDD